MNPIFLDIEKIPAVRRHWANGVSCYHFAMGHENPVISINSKDPHRRVSLISYATLAPGHSANDISSLGDHLDFKTLRTLVLQGCQQDGLIDQGRSIDTQNDFPRLALYFNSRLADWHYVVQTPDGKIEDKVPFRDKKSYSCFPEQIGGYFLDRFYTKPPEAKISELARLKTQTKVMNTPDGCVTFDQITASGIGYVGRDLILDRARKLAYVTDLNLFLPFPASGPPLF